MREWARIGALLGVVCGWASRADAAEPPKVAVLPVEVEGELPDDVREQIVQRVVSVMQSDAFVPIKAHIGEAEQCEDFACMHAAAKQVDAEFIVVPSVGTLGHDYGIAVHLYDITGALKASEEGTCEICSYGEAVDMLAEQAGLLTEPLRGLIENPYAGRETARRELLGPTQLRLSSTPVGADVTIDGLAVGRTPLTLEVRPGLRNVEISKRGHLAVRQSVRARKGELTKVDVELFENLERQNRALRISGLAFGISGIPLLAGGVALLVLHDRPMTNCQEDATGSCQDRYDTIRPGGALTGIGLASIVVGLSTGLVYYSRKQRAEKQRRRREFEAETVVVTPIVGPGGAGLKVRF